MNDGACKVPLAFLLREVPKDARLVIDKEFGTQFIPVGRICHEAAEMLMIEQQHMEPIAWIYDWYAEDEDIDGVPTGGLVNDWITANYDEAHSPTNGCHNIRPLYLRPAITSPATIKLEEFARRVMRDHQAQLPSEARDLYGGGCGCPQCEAARDALGERA